MVDKRPYLEKRKNEAKREIIRGERGVKRNEKKKKKKKKETSSGQPIN